MDNSQNLFWCPPPPPPGAPIAPTLQTYYTGNIDDLMEQSRNSLLQWRAAQFPYRPHQAEQQPSDFAMYVNPNASSWNSVPPVTAAQLLVSQSQWGGVSYGQVEGANGEMPPDWELLCNEEVFLRHRECFVNLSWSKQMQMPHLSDTAPAPAPEQAVPERAAPEQAAPERAAPEQAAPEPPTPEPATPAISSCISIPTDLSPTPAVGALATPTKATTKKAQTSASSGRKKKSAPVWSARRCSVGGCVDRTRFTTATDFVHHLRTTHPNLSEQQIKHLRMGKLDEYSVVLV